MSKRPQLTRLWASAGEFETVPHDKYDQGFVKEKPSHEYLNDLQKKEEEFYIANMESGVPILNTAEPTTFKEGALACVEEADTCKLKVRKEGKWKEVLFDSDFLSMTAKLQAISDKLRNHALDVSNPHGVTANQTGAYSTSQADAKVKVVQDALNQHEAKEDNPHSVTYTQLNTLGAHTGGSFTGEVSLLGGVVLAGKKVITTDKRFTIGDIGIDSGDPVVYLPERNVLFCESNYLEQRNKVEPLYATPPEDIRIPFGSDLTAWHSYTEVNTDWDNLVFDKVKGLKADGVVSFTGKDFLGSEMTVSVRISGQLDLTLGSTQIKATGTKVTVIDGSLTTHCNYSVGTLVLVRSTGDIKLYIDGVLLADKAGSLPTMTTDCTIKGAGYIKDLRVWASAFTHEQVTQA